MSDSVRDRIAAFLQVAHLASCREIAREICASEGAVKDKLACLMDADFVRAWPEKFVDTTGEREITHYFRTLKPYVRTTRVVELPLARSVITRHAEQAAKAPVDLINAFRLMVAL